MCVREREKSEKRENRINKREREKESARENENKSKRESVCRVCVVYVCDAPSAAISVILGELGEEATGGWWWW